MWSIAKSKKLITTLHKLTLTNRCRGGGGSSASHALLSAFSLRSWAISAMRLKLAKNFKLKRLLCTVNKTGTENDFTKVSHLGSNAIICSSDVTTSRLIKADTRSVDFNLLKFFFAKT